MKKFLSCLLAAMMLLGMVAISGAGADDYDFKIVVQRHALDKSDGYATKLGAIEAEKNTGLKIDYYELEASTVSEKVGIMLASGDLPDAFINTVNQSQVTQNLPLFVQLDEYLTEENCPHVMEIFAQYPEVKDAITQTDGHIYTLPTSMYVSNEDDGSSIQFINKAWLDDLVENLQYKLVSDKYVNKDLILGTM